MYRERLEPGQATRFLFARRQPLTFSMRNTPLFLDMNLLAANRSIAECTEPISDALCRVAGGSQNVVEVPVRGTTGHRIAPDMPAHFVNVD